MLTDYYSNIENGIAKLQALYAETVKRMSYVAQPDYDTTNWSDILCSIQDAINQLKILDSIHQFERLSKSEMKSLMQAYEDGSGSGKVVIPYQYTVKDYDTPRLISLNFGIAWPTIAQYNGITDSFLIAGTIILIPLTEEISQRISKNILVFGDQTGIKILGTDLPNALTAENGDLQVLNEKDSFKQNIDNILLTVKGDYPFYESFGGAVKMGQDYSGDALLSMVQMGISDSITADARIKEIDVLNVSKSDDSPTKVNIELQVTAAQGESIIVKV